MGKDSLLFQAYRHYKCLCKLRWTFNNDTNDTKNNNRGFVIMFRAVARQRSSVEQPQSVKQVRNYCTQMVFLFIN